jgi:hypothetical protein
LCCDQKLGHFLGLRLELRGLPNELMAALHNGLEGMVHPEHAFVVGGDFSGPFQGKGIAPIRGIIARDRP